MKGRKERREGWERDERKKREKGRGRDRGKNEERKKGNILISQLFFHHLHCLLPSDVLTGRKRANFASRLQSHPATQLRAG